MFDNVAQSSVSQSQHINTTLTATLRATFLSSCPKECHFQRLLIFFTPILNFITTFQVTGSCHQMACMKCLGCRALDYSKWWIRRDLEENMILYHILMYCKFIRMKNVRKSTIACFRTYNSNSGFSQWKARKLCRNMGLDCFKTVLNGTEVLSIQILSTWVTRKWNLPAPEKLSVPYGSFDGRCFVV